MRTLLLNEVEFTLTLQRGTVTSGEEYLGQDDDDCDEDGGCSGGVPWP